MAEGFASCSPSKRIGKLQPNLKAHDLRHKNSRLRFILFCGFSGGLEHLIMLRFGDALFDELFAFAAPFVIFVFARRLRRFVVG